jgi:hypothetical protein
LYLKIRVIKGGEFFKTCEEEQELVKTKWTFGEVGKGRLTNFLEAKKKKVQRWQENTKRC